MLKVGDAEGYSLAGSDQVVEALGDLIPLAEAGKKVYLPESAAISVAHP